MLYYCSIELLIEAGEDTSGAFKGLAESVGRSRRMP
jgi:hypothetical protein